MGPEARSPRSEGRDQGFRIPGSGHSAAGLRASGFGPDPDLGLRPSDFGPRTSGLGLPGLAISPIEKHPQAQLTRSDEIQAAVLVQIHDTVLPA